ncbi:MULTISPECIES: hypothetical protein [Ramlibacter]|uniref:Uncharacterized protein n=1 Tax=Ramlibacter pinisoli TaxID=2682844 RepID=A0A6N8IRC6_9BURK|nr:MULTISPECIES: hypothetical protein [Ramlibacter]MBA2964431.1 hypothetical protein [Ramlibacter sp. CGMCC 1.13660]MVQ29397.1 hypothetical protein [Ramlibacter pinisoli]
MGLLLTAAASSAAWPLAFGSLEGSARFGSPLDVRLPLVLGHPAEALAPCVQVDAWYGRGQLDAASLRSDVQIVGKTGGSVRVRVARPVDQPVVTLAVSTTCGLRTERTFVLLAENLPPDFQAVMPEAESPAAAAVPANAVQPPEPAVTVPAAASAAPPGRATAVAAPRPMAPVLPASSTRLAPRPSRRRQSPRHGSQHRRRSPHRSPRQSPRPRPKSRCACASRRGSRPPSRPAPKPAGPKRGRSGRSCRPIRWCWRASCNRQRRRTCRRQCPCL